MKGYKPDWLGHAGGSGAERSAELLGNFQQSPKEVRAALQYAVKETIAIPPGGSVTNESLEKILERTCLVFGKDPCGKERFEIVFPTISTSTRKVGEQVLDFARKLSEEAISQAEKSGGISPELGSISRSAMEGDKMFVPGRFVLRGPWRDRQRDNAKAEQRVLRDFEIGGGNKIPVPGVIVWNMPSEVGKIDPKLAIAVPLGAGAVVLFAVGACQATNMIQTPDLEKIVRETLEAMNATGIPQPSATQKAPEVTNTHTVTATKSPETTQTVENQGTHTQNVEITQAATQVETPVPADLKFLDGREVSPMISDYTIDKTTGLNAAIDVKGNIVAYYLKTTEVDKWVINPLLEMGFPWNFDRNESGELIQHNMLEQWGYKAYPIEGVKFIRADQLPATFWDESDPVNPEDHHPWPQNGTLAVTDRFGNILMYYSLKENSWWYAGYQQELPRNMIYRQSGTVMETVGVRHFPAGEDVWPDVEDHWIYIRRNVDWFAYTRRTGNNISLEEFIRRTDNGEIFSYSAWVYDLQRKEYILTDLDQNTVIKFTGTFFGKHDLSYVDTFDGDGNMPNGRDEWTSVQLNPDGSLSITGGNFIDRLNTGRISSYIGYMGAGVSPFELTRIGVLAASDKEQKEGLGADFFMSISQDLQIAYESKLGKILVSDTSRLRAEPEFILKEYLYLVPPDVY